MLEEVVEMTVPGWMVVSRVVGRFEIWEELLSAALVGETLVGDALVGDVVVGNDVVGGGPVGLWQLSMYHLSFSFVHVKNKSREAMTRLIFWH